MKRPAKLELKNGERFLTAPDVSIFTDDTTLKVGDVYDLDDFLFIWQYECEDIWLDMPRYIPCKQSIERYGYRQVARKKAVAETPVKEWDWYGWLCARIPELKSKKNKWWLNQCVHELVNCKPELQGKKLMANGEWAVNDGKDPEAMNELKPPPSPICYPTMEKKDIAPEMFEALRAIQLVLLDWGISGSAKTDKETLEQLFLIADGEDLVRKMREVTQNPASPSQ